MATQRALLAAWFNSLPGSDPGIERFNSLVALVATARAEGRAEGMREAAEKAASFKYSHQGSEDENTLIGMFARGNRNAKKKIAAAILAAIPQETKP